MWIFGWTLLRLVRPLFLFAFRCVSFPWCGPAPSLTFLIGHVPKLRMSARCASGRLLEGLWTAGTFFASSSSPSLCSFPSSTRESSTTKRAGAPLLNYELRHMFFQCFFCLLEPQSTNRESTLRTIAGHTLDPAVSRKSPNHYHGRKTSTSSSSMYIQYCMDCHRVLDPPSQQTLLWWC